MKLALRIVWACVVLGACFGCAHYYENPRAMSQAANRIYDFDSLTATGEADSIFLCLAFSGGGTRAAALAYGVLQELADTAIPGSDRTLLDEVDCISSVSGGSFTAVYYALFRGKLFSDFRDRFLDRNVERALLWRVANPVNWFRLGSPWFSRIDLAGELYQDTIFGGATFSDLAAQGRPLIVLSATNLESGRRFDFNREQFDAIGSSLATFPLGRAVAASSAFPFLLSPVSLRNHVALSDYEPPGWLGGSLEKTARYSDPRRHEAGRQLDYYLKARQDGSKRHPFVHLMDGGLADNVGSRVLLDEYRRGFIRSRILKGEVGRLVFVLVNARTQHREDLSSGERSPGIGTVAHKTATVSMDNYSFESVALTQDMFRSRLQAQADIEACRELLGAACPEAPLPPPMRSFDPYVIEVNFQDAAFLEDEDPEYYLNLPTSFRLEREQVDAIVAVGRKLFRAAPSFACLRTVLRAEARGEPRPKCSGIAGP